MKYLLSNWAGPVEFVTYTRSEINSYSTIADDVSGSAAPALPGAADTWRGPNNA